MKLRQSSALNVGGGSQPPAATNQDHPRETQTRKKCTQTGALQLAAIVHYDSLASYCPAAAAAAAPASNGEKSCSRATSAASSSSCSCSSSARPGELANNKSHVSLSPPDRLQANERCASECDTKSGGQQVVLLEDTHEESGGQAKREKTKIGSKFSRLFFTKNKSKHQPASMIDSHDQGDSHAPPPPPPLKTREGHPGEEESCSSSGAAAAAASAAMSQVIEFKFDLIVEGEQEEGTQKPDNDHDEKLDHDKLSGHTLDSLVSRKILRPIQQRKLLDQVNELVESFVLDSMDVCLMTTGRGSRVRSTFEYLLQSAELSLAYAFQLLAAVGPHRGKASSCKRTLTAECSPLQVDEHSIELEALLFIEHAREPLQVVDLTANLVRDCSSAREALELIEQIEAQLSAQANLYQSALMINLKLKQQVQGGLFTNRMCLLDMGERPKSSQLRPVLESIFSGQALAYLKAQKLRLHELGAVATCARDISNDDQSNKHHHHNASQQQQQQQQPLEHLSKLSQAEWLVYKQLSSALIKSLMIVHCRRLTPNLASGNQNEDQEHDRKFVEAYLMEYNLNLLEFASAIKRAASSRLKRRRRHLRSHLTNQTTGSNLSLASDTQNNYYNKSYGSSSPGGAYHHHRHHDLMISSPFRHAKTVHRNHHHNHHRQCCDSPPPPPPPLQHSQIPVLPAHLVDRYNQSYSSRSRAHRGHRHHRHRHDHHKHETDSYSAGCHKCLRHVHGRATSLNRRRSHDLLGGASSSSYRQGDWLETSSQLSTSSGSQRTLSSSARRQFVAEGRALDADLDLEDSLATTTLHSGSLNAAAQHQRHRRSGSTSIRCGGGGGDGVWPAGPASSVASWAARARLQLQQRALDMQSSPSGTLDDSIELQSFRSSSSGVTPNLATLTQQGAHVASRGGPGLEPPDDSIPDPPSPLEAESDPCPPVVAEPPRQLKLEQFLNQLTSAISGPPAALPVERMPRQRDSREREEDDDEDCRSHSSILEHLSSLALESNMKMVKQQQQQQQRHVSPLGESRVSIVSNDSAPHQAGIMWPLENANGHLQQLLKSTLKLHQSQQQQNPLTIDCGEHHLDASSTTTAAIGANLSESTQRTTNGFTPPTSIESGCSSSASSSSTSSGRHATGGATRGGLEQQPCVAGKTAANMKAQLYTSQVIKQNT